MRPDAVMRNIPVNALGEAADVYVAVLCVFSRFPIRSDNVAPLNIPNGSTSNSLDR